MAWFSKSSEDPAQTDEQALARYRYMLKTAPPEAIEQAHEEAFRQLTPEQRKLALQQLAADAPAEERSSADEDPKSLARLATRTEIRQPGALERLFGRTGASGTGSGFGGMFAGTLLATLAGTVLGSAVAHSFFDVHPFADTSSSNNAIAEYHEPGSTFEDVSLDEDLDSGFEDLA
jgi:hypothetical protein